MAARIVRMGKGKPTPYDGLVKVVNGEARWTGEVRLVPETLVQPLHWRQPSTVFVDSMSDLFHESLTNEQIAAAFGVMAACPQHQFLVLTKRARRMRECFRWIGKSITRHWHGRWGVLFEHLGTIIGESAMEAAWQRAIADEPTPANLGDAGCHAWPLPNVWLGVSVESQDAADARIPDLLATPAALRFLSCEPLLGPLDLTHRLGVWTSCPDCGYGVSIDEDGCCATCGLDAYHYGADWVIAGCESGHGARPCDVAWLRSLRDQCAAARVPYFLKQAKATPGELVPGMSATWVVGADDGSKIKAGGVVGLPYLDGVQHAAFPEVKR
jgi:protein gp37